MAARHTQKYHQKYNKIIQYKRLK